VKNKRVPTRIDQHVGNRVRQRRLMMGWSQAKLGKALGVSFQQVQKYERAINRIGASRLQNAAEILEVPVAFFFEGPERSEDKDLDEYAEFLLTSEGSSLVQVFMNIREPRIRRRIIALLEEIADSQHVGRRPELRERR
jgi:transcriptional regulator with XRE-family HTH domain